MAGEETKKSATALAAEAALAEQRAATDKRKAATRANTTTKDAALSALAEGGSLSNTAIEAPPSFWNQLGPSIKRSFVDAAGSELPSEGDLDPKLGQASDMARMGIPGMLAALPTGAIGLLDTFANRDERLGKTTPLTTGATAVVDTLSIGSLNKIGAVIDTGMGNAPRRSSPVEELSHIWQRETGGDIATYAEQLDARALEQAEIRAANPMTALGGDVLGSVITGGLLTKAVYNTLAKSSGPVAKTILGKAPETAGKLRSMLTGSTARTLGFGSLLGGAEATAYSLNKFGDIEKAAVDGVLATLGGIVLGGTLAGAVATGRKVSGKYATDYIQNEVGKAYLANINIDNAVAGKPAATASDVAAQIEALGPDATLMDAFPSLKKFANYFIGSDATKKDALPLYDLLRQRASFQSDLYSPDGGLRAVFGEQVVRSVDTFTTSVKDRFKKLQPRYAAIYADNQDLTFSGKQILDNLEATLPPVSRRKGGQLRLMRDLNKEIAVLQKQATRTKAGGNKVDALTLEQTVGLKQWLQDAIGDKQSTVTNSAKTKPLTNTAIRDYTLAAKYIEGLLDNAVPEMVPLNAVYGNLASLKTAYKAGVKTFSSTAKDSADVAAFMAGDTSAAERRAFVEGAKYHLFNKLSAASSPEAIEKILADNRPMVLKMESMFGKEATGEMVQAARGMVTKVKTVRDLERAATVASGGDMLNANTGLKPLLDAGIALLGVPGLTSKAAGLGALGRLTAGGPNQRAVSETSQYGSDILTRMGEGASDAFQELQRMTERSALASDSYRAVLPGGMAAATGAALNDPE